MSSPRLLTAKAYINHFATLNPTILHSILAENYIHTFAPSSMNPPGPLSKDQFITHMTSLREIMTGFPVSIKECVESEGSNQVTVWATSRTEFREEVEDTEMSEQEWVYEGEYVFMFWMDDIGQKIVRTVEFLDSEGTNGVLRPLMKRARRNLEAYEKSKKK